MTLIFGLVLIALAAGAFVYSLPRGGRTARFVGTKWEGYAVVVLIGAVGIGIIMAITGAIQLAA